MLQRINTEGYSKETAWCGPSAISALTGVPLKVSTELLCRIIRCVSYEKLSGVNTVHMIAALGELGYVTKPVKEFADRYADLPMGPTLRRYLAERTATEKFTPLLIEIAGHYVTAHLSFTCDNWSKKPIPSEDSPHLNKLVKRVFTVQPKGY